MNLQTHPVAAKFFNNLTPDQIPQGLCKCGCGMRTPLPRQGETARGYVRGRPVDYCPKHNRGVAKGKPFFVIDHQSGCWNWTGKPGTDGYGDVKFAERMFKSHILYYILAKGDVPVGCELDHLCSNRRCVNPDHMEPVTHLENVRRGKATKLTVENVEEIRRLHATGKFGYRTLARQFGVTYPQVAKIVKGRSWVAHL